MEEKPKSEFQIKLERFEGPYPKLLELIEERKLSITEISLVQIADTYISYVQSLKEKNLVDISQFIVVASTLILMKAKSLIPGSTYTGEEEKQVHDLERKLELFSLLVAAVDRFKALYGKTPLYGRERIAYKGGMAFVPDKRISPKFIHSVAILTLESFEVNSPKTLTKVAVAQAVRIENVIEKMLDRIRHMSSFRLDQVADQTETIEDKKKTIIVHFIALLELLRQGEVTAVQHERTGVIEISHKEEPIHPPQEQISQTTQPTHETPQAHS